MSIEKITSKIIGEAEDQKNIVLADAKEKSDAILSEARIKAEKMIESAKQQGEAEKEKMITRHRSVSGIDSRKVILAKKQQMIADCFDKTVEAITKLDRNEYISLLVNMGKNSGSKTGLLIFNDKERQTIGAEVTAALNEAVDGGRYGLSEETKNIRGGFILKCGQTYINNTIEALVDENKDKITREIAEMLFPA